MKRFDKIMERKQRLMKGIASVCLMGMCLMTCADVILRSTLNKPIFGSEEIVSIFAILAIGFALPYSHRKNSHVGVEILMRLLSRKVQKRVRFITNIFAFLLFMVLSWKMTVYGHVMQHSGELSMNLELPMYYFVYALAFCLFIMALSVLQDILEFFQEMRGKHDAF
ncbi:MAG: TRAP transporter small permease [Desulfobacterales bacterium]|nr:TRAP transporter small permease [Desulfobacterales bacterium]